MSRSSTTTEVCARHERAAKPPPRRVLLEEFLSAPGLSQNAPARAVGMPPRGINGIVLGKRGISADIAVRLAAALGTSERFWLGLQADNDLEEARRVLGAKLAEIERIAGYCCFVLCRAVPCRGAGVLAATLNASSPRMRRSRALAIESSHSDCPHDSAAGLRECDKPGAAGYSFDFLGSVWRPASSGRPGHSASTGPAGGCAALIHPTTAGGGSNSTTAGDAVGGSKPRA